MKTGKKKKKNCIKVPTSIYKTASTMCSKTRGPAMSPDFVTWPA